MTSLTVAGALLVAVLVPEVLPHRRLRPLTGAVISLAGLALRALAAVLAAVALLSYLPATQLFALITGWCLDGVAPLLSSHRGVSGHGLGETALLVPAVALALSLLWALVAVARRVRTMARWLRGSTLGAGPADSLIVAGPEVLVAATGLRAPRVVVSAGALTELDDAELAASLEHERGHIQRRHRYVLVAANVLFGAARFVPGSRRALQRLSFHLERDADEFALRRGGEPLALATAIAKASQSIVAMPMPATQLAGADTAARLKLLVRPPGEGGRLARWSARSLATLLVGTTLAVGLTVPGLAWATAGQLHKPVAIVHCD